MPSTPEMFDQISPTYDRINRILSLGQDLRWRKKVAEFLPLKPHLEILDLATGTGDQLMALYKAGASIRRAVGIDLAEEMLKIGRMKFDASSYSGVELLVGDAQKIPFAAEQFDAATFSFGIRNVEDPLLSLKEIYRVLKLHGRCLILEFSIPTHFFRPLFLFYLRKVLPRLGGWLSSNSEAYRYLNQSIEKFPSGKPFLSLLQKAGFSRLRRYPMNFGTVTLYVGEKSE